MQPSWPHGHRGCRPGTDGYDSTPEVRHDVLGPADGPRRGDTLHSPVPDEDPGIALVGRRVDE
eukprot:8624298-Alexandrium_andersonii.AAC.1